MVKEQKIALGFGILALVATVLAAVLIKPSPEVWSKAEHIRQVIGLGAAALVLAYLVASLEGRQPPSTREEPGSTGHGPRGQSNKPPDQQ